MWFSPRHIGAEQLWPVDPTPDYGINAMINLSTAVLALLLVSTADV
jgi:hypothetical protein